MWPSAHSITQLFTVTVVIVNTDPAFMGQFREIEHTDHDLAACLDAVTELIWQGYSLYAVTLRDQHHQLKLPVDSFDGRPLSPTLCQLEYEWERILAVNPANQPD